MSDSLSTRFKWAVVGFFERQIDTLIGERILMFARKIKEDGVMLGGSSVDCKRQSGPSSPDYGLSHLPSDRRE